MLLYVFLLPVFGGALTGSDAVGVQTADADLPRVEPRVGVRVATLNVHYLKEWSDDPVMHWHPRHKAVVAVMRAIDADIFAFQEMETFDGRAFNPDNRQADTIHREFPEYRAAAMGPAEVFPNTQPIFFRHDRLRLEDEGFFFFSPTPDVPYSRPWFGRYPSFATWARFTDRTSEVSLLVVNVHIDNDRYRTMVRSSDLVVDRVAGIRRDGDRVIVLGDFNAFRFMPVVRRIAAGTGTAAAPGNGSTFHFYRGLRLFPAIDHVLVDTAFHVTASRTVRSRPDDVWPSDHFPVVVDVRFR